MSDVGFVVFIACCYFGIGLLLSGASVRVWRKKDSKSRLAKFLFPWNAYEKCVGELASYSICGELMRSGRSRITAYIVAMLFIWPVKVLWCIPASLFFQARR